MLIICYKKGTKKVLYRYSNVHKFEVRNDLLYIYPLYSLRIKIPLEEVDFVCLV